MSEIDLVSGGFWASDPHDALTWMRRHAPVYWDGKNEVWGISRYRDVREISSRPKVFSNAEGIRPDSGPLPMMIDMDDPEHFRRRRLVSSGFTPRRVRQNQTAIRKACDEIIDAVCEAAECDFVNDVAAWLPMIMIGDALGIAPEDRSQLLQWSDDMMRGLIGQDGATMERAAEAFAGYSAYADLVIHERRANPGDDLISLLVHAEVDGHHLDHDSLIHESLLILIGGDETTRHVITGGMYQLLIHPDQKTFLRSHPDKIPVAVEEMLRWVSPIKNMARTVVADTVVGDQPLRAGETVLLLYPSANRDEEVFVDPFRFDVQRHPNEHVAFGFGPHFCLGHNLARLELQVMFEQLLRRIPDLELVDGAPPPYRVSNFVTGFETMPVRFSPSPRSTSRRYHQAVPGGH